MVKSRAQPPKDLGGWLAALPFHSPHLRSFYLLASSSHSAAVKLSPSLCRLAKMGIFIFFKQQDHESKPGEPASLSERLQSLLRNCDTILVRFFKLIILSSLTSGRKRWFAKNGHYMTVSFIYVIYDIWHIFYAKIKHSEMHRCSSVGEQSSPAWNRVSASCEFRKAMWQQLLPPYPLHWTLLGS